MKKLLLLAVAIIGYSTITIAQDKFDKAEIELYQSIYGMEKKAVLQEYLDIPAEHKDLFWELYDTYETEREELGKQSITLLYKYVNTHDQISDEELKEIMTTSISTRSKSEKLRTKYYKKIAKEVNIKTATKFYQLENYFQGLLSVSVIESLPFIQKKQMSH